MVFERTASCGVDYGNWGGGIILGVVFSRMEVYPEFVEDVGVDGGYIVSIVVICFRYLFCIVNVACGGVVSWWEEDVFVRVDFCCGNSDEGRKVSDQTCGLRKGGCLSLWWGFDSVIIK